MANAAVVAPIRMAAAVCGAVASLLAITETLDEPPPLFFLAVFFFAGLISGRLVAGLLVPASALVVAIIYAVFTPDQPGTYSEFNLLGQIILTAVVFLVCCGVTTLGAFTALCLEGMLGRHESD